ncbi:hypothetical protein [Spongiactinospora sp. TRM90649]|uniref:hypothetical protein n=1 Tax=Spongiactinospora sp. TRM90649 TaxID=3031114 RepID=UPI0023F61EF9|nr:hypothetical protein [Spongiactinospora sp. TRM90649]MDF5753242.1 hypothetical protein [Spongiactinospora sp. TRM90649]
MERYETIPRAGGVEEGLAARVHDPLWLLARQWQFGEFTAEDAASAAWVDLTAEIHLLDRWRPIGEDADRPYDRMTEPLERLIEQEVESRPDPGLRVAGGLRLRRALLDAGHGDLFALFVNACPFPVDGKPPPPAEGGIPARIRSRLPDGAALAGPLARLADPAQRADEAANLGLSSAGADTIAPFAADWLAWWNARAPKASDDAMPVRPETWDVHRLEYAFELGAASLPDVRLRATGHPGGRLEWWAADAVPGAATPPEGAPLTLTDVRAVPTPARFGGMPVPRFWECEDAGFDPGGIDAAPSDLGRLLLTAFVTYSGEDWLMLPVRLPVGSLTRVTGFRVTDVFGGKRVLDPAGAADDGWSLFTLTDAAGPSEPGRERPTSPWFFLPPALPDALDGPPLESVLYLRDEMVNLAWAVEPTVPDDAGGVIDRFATDPPPPESAPLPPGSPPRYRVETSVPLNWYPLAPEKLADQESILLRLVPLVRGDDPEGKPREPLGELLTEGDGGGVWLYEEEVPRAGTAVSRAARQARWHDGSTHFWTTRVKGTGGGEGSSGLRFDILEP